MKRSSGWRRLLPEAGEAAGVTIPFWFLVMVAVVSTVRSLIHLLAADGGAHTIAGLAIDGAGGQNLAALFAQWGASQLLLAIIYWVVIWRYRFLTPLMLAIILLEQLLRLAAGHLKPLDVATPPPGAYYTDLLLPVAAIMLIWSLVRAPSR
jgi:hypothetical protein